MKSIRSRSSRRSCWVVRGTRAAGTALLCALLFGPVMAAEVESSGSEVPAVPPGQEELLGEMLGKGAALPDKCRLAAGGAAYTIVEATYACPGGEVTFKLSHPSKAEPSAVLTEKFAITPESGTAPEKLAATLVALVRAREADFVWTMPAAAVEDEDQDESASGQ